MKIRKGSLSDFILVSLEKTVDGYVRLEDFLYNTHIYAKGYDRPLKKSGLSQTLWRLRKKGLIESNRELGGLVYKLTMVGENLIKKDTKVTDQVWDGIWRVVIFDVPENQRKVRRILRSRLKLWGFVPWQKSVWASKDDLFSEVKGIIKELEIDDWVVILESNKISK